MEKNIKDYFETSVLGKNIKPYSVRVLSHYAIVACDNGDGTLTICAEPGELFVPEYPHKIDYKSGLLDLGVDREKLQQDDLLISFTYGEE